MRKLLFYILLTGISACETERIIFEGPYHVRFTDAALTEKESYSKIIKIEIHNVGPALTKSTSISYTISGNARQGIDFEIVGTPGQVTIEDDEYVGFIEVQLINNANNILRSQDVTFTLTGVTAADYQVGQGEGGIGKKFTLTIADDCILGGSYTGTRDNSSASVTGIGLTSTDCETYRVSNWNVDIFDYPFDLGLTFIDNGDNTLTIPSQQQPEFPEESATITGSGSVNPTNNEIRLLIQFVGFDPPFERSITLKPE